MIGQSPRQRSARLLVGLSIVLVLVVSVVTKQPVATAAEAAGAAVDARPRLLRTPPLQVSPKNPRYFSGPDGKPIYLTGSHIWNNLHDGLGPGAECAAEPEVNDYAAYLRFLSKHHHNFIRMWRWENFRSQAAGGAPFHLCMTPQPWPRTGPRTASDGKPAFDLNAFDEAYFSRLRERVVGAGRNGIYVSVMLFDGFCLQLCSGVDAVAGHPFAHGNNVQGLAIAGPRDYQVLPLDGRIQGIQRAYIRKVVETVHDLPNVLYEVSNETVGESTSWQYWVINQIKADERALGHRRPHPVGMTMQYPVVDQSKVNEPLLDSPADWISPGFDDVNWTGRWYTDPPANDGRKVYLSDTDHYAAGQGDALWAWKSFLRGHNPILMDFGIIDVANPLDPSLGVPSYESYAPARFAMGDSRALALRTDLARLKPRGDLTDTRYALAAPGREYVILQPKEGSFSVTVAAGTYRVSWYDVNTRRMKDAGELKVDRATSKAFSTPFDGGPAVLHLH